MKRFSYFPYILSSLFFTPLITHAAIPFNYPLTLKPSATAPTPDNYSLTRKSSAVAKTSNDYPLAVKPSAAVMSQMDIYYKLKVQNKQRAYELITRIARENPGYYEAQAEAGYLAVDLKQNKQAINYFEQAYRLQPKNYDLAMQLGYMYDEMYEKAKARKFFAKATKSTDPKIYHDANVSLINLADSTFKTLPNPYFVDFYAEPMHETRFKDTIWSSQTRAGINFGDRQQLQVYANNRYIRDTKSVGGELPDIINDNVVIYGAGARYYPFKDVSLFTYIEYGRAYDLVDQNRDRGRNDLRGGVLYGKYWGALVAPDYSDKPIVEFKQFGDIYADVSYYSRYDDDVIGQFRLQQGAQLFRFKNTTARAYMKGQYFFDTNREFFNNIVEVGPGISIQPFNQINLTLHAEHLFGYYIPVNSPDENPFNSHYQENQVFAEFEMVL